MVGPLEGLRVLELGSIGPGPHAAMLLGDLGADVVRIDRPRGPDPFAGEVPDQLMRNRRSVCLDLKQPADRDLAMQLADRADVLVEGYRPGVTERLGMGPADCLSRNPRLVYGRMTGWGQSGPMAPRAGHDINYISLTGVLHAMGREGESPVPPLNLVGDFGGGSMFLLVGILSALWERERSGRGQVVDAAMVDGISVLAQMIWAMRASGTWSEQRASNLLDGGTPYYDTYACADGRFVAVGAIEPQFYAALLDGLGLAGEALPCQQDRAGWPTLRSRFAGVFATRTRDDWAEHFAGTDACVTPVLTFTEAAAHPHLLSRGTFVERDGIIQPAAAPRLSRTAAATPSPPPVLDGDRKAVLADWGIVASTG
ncbi:MAG: CoA transferase [Modestobacter sp.]|jgi:alpha-methylacyl-CoA racemase|nr:CoA transferase [Modestobacter sp.]